MPTKSHLLTAALAGSLGIAATLAAGGVPEVDAYPLSRKITVLASYLNSNPVISQIWDNVESAGCPAAEEKASLLPGTCSVQEGTVVSLSRGAEETKVSTSFRLPGTWIGD